MLHPAGPMLTWLIPAVAITTGGVLSALGTWLTRRWACRRGFIDRPGGHKRHAIPVALGGGIPIMLAATLPIVVTAMAVPTLLANPPAWLPADVQLHLGGIAARAPIALRIVVAVAFICVVGVVDDARAMRPGVKFAAQVVAALFIVVGCNLRLMTMLGDAASIGLTLLWILTLVNAMNFLDNMDGLAAGVGLIAAAVFAESSMFAGQIFVPTWCWLLVGALAGFLPFNASPASIYMGDAGSLVIGLLLAVFTILTTYADPSAGQRPFGVLAPLVVMAVPLYDTASVILRRWRIGRPIWSGDHRHFSHRLVRRGMSPRKAVFVIWLATLTTALPALLLPQADWPLAAGIMLQTLLVVCMIALLESSPLDDDAQSD